MAHPRKPPYMRKNRAKILYARRATAHFLPNFVAMATGVGRGKVQLAAFDGPSPKTLLHAQKSRKNLLRKPSYSPFCPKFRCHGNQEKAKGMGKENREEKEEGKWGRGKGRTGGEGEGKG